jgi:thiol-disulfide isomerase/thioredoxin
MVGKPAPDFSIDVLDGPGKTRKVSRADLAGKVVLLDFWATWCGPCLEELPDVQKLIDSYAKAKKDVVVLALSIDRSEAGDLKETRDKVEETLKERKVTLAAEGNPVGVVALDPLNKVAQAFDVGAIPFVVLIDAQGIVRSVHVGLTEGSVFAAEIDALLAGKPVDGGK